MCFEKPVGQLEQDRKPVLPYAHDHILVDHAGMVDTYVNAHAGTQNLFDIGKSDNDVKVRISAPATCLKCDCDVRTHQLSCT